MITKSVILRCGIERAFELFTEHAGQWWPAERRHTNDPRSTIRIESSGKFYERAADGTEVDLGVVRAFEPARRLTIDWYPGTGERHATRVEVLFESIEEGTRVTIHHDEGNAPAALFARNAPGYVRSWDLVVAALVRSAADPLPFS